MHVPPANGFPMQILKRTLAVVFTAALAAAPTFAQAVSKDAATAKAPDFSGQWELNVAKSDFGPMAQQAPTKGTMSITQSATSLKFTQSVSTPMGDQNITQEFTLDGQEHTMNGADGQPVTSAAKFDGDALVVNSKLNRQGMDITQVSRWTLSPDGKAISVDRQLATPMGPMSLKLVFDKK